MAEHSLGCDPWGTVLGRCKSVDDFFIVSLAAYASSRSVPS